MVFKYSLTCPKIDKSIVKCRKKVEKSLKSLIHKLCPMIPDSSVNKIAKEETETVFVSLEDIFEEVRETNSNMRKAAEDQIDSVIYRLEYRIDELKERLKRK